MAVETHIKYRDEDLKKLEQLNHQLEDSKKSTQSKLDTLEKFVMDNKEAQAKEVREAKQQQSGQLSVSEKVLGDVKELKDGNGMIMYKIGKLELALDQAKLDLEKQKKEANETLAKLEKLDFKIDTMPHRVQAGLGVPNFMSNNPSNVTDNSHPSQDGHGHVAPGAGVVQSKEPVFGGGNHPGSKFESRMSIKEIDERDFGSNKPDFDGFSIIDMMDGKKGPGGTGSSVLTIRNQRHDARRDLECWKHEDHQCDR